MKKKIYDCNILRNIHRIESYKLVYGVFIRPSKDGMALSVCLSIRPFVRPQLLVNAIS